MDPDKPINATLFLIKTVHYHEGASFNGMYAADLAMLFRAIPYFADFWFQSAHGLAIDGIKSETCQQCREHCNFVPHKLKFPLWNLI